jgi:hypothetical protein
MLSSCPYTEEAVCGVRSVGTHTAHSTSMEHVEPVLRPCRDRYAIEMAQIRDLMSRIRDLMSRIVLIWVHLHYFFSSKTPKKNVVLLRETTCNCFCHIGARYICVYMGPCVYVAVLRAAVYILWDV